MLAGLALALVLVVALAGIAPRLRVARQTGRRRRSAGGIRRRFRRALVGRRLGLLVCSFHAIFYPGAMPRKQDRRGRVMLVVSVLAGYGLAF